MWRAANSRRAFVGSIGAAALLPLTRLLAGTPAGQQPAAPQQPFRAGTRTVPVYVSVIDDIGQLVQDVRREEFEIRDNGQVQAISLFTTEAQPITTIVLMDGSRSIVNALKTVMTAADHFVVRMMPGDRARVGSFSEEIRFAPAFSADRDALAREVNDLFDLRVGMRTRLWDALNQATQSFEGAQGRKAIVVFTDGEDTSSIELPVNVLNRARRADIMMYAVLIRGVRRLPEDRPAGGGRRARPQDLADMAIATGGGYYSVNNVLDDLNSIATQIASELHNQYVIGFVPQELDGKLHRLEVRVKRPRVKVRARESYLAEPE
jgi:Ca-activated chloride channel family protein